MYSTKYFLDNPQIAQQPGLLYLIVLVNKQTLERECLKIGITKGTSNKDVITRGSQFRHYELRIQAVFKATLEEVYHLEQYLHEKHQKDRVKPKLKFGGHTECFSLGIFKEVLAEIKNEGFKNA